MPGDQPSLIGHECDRCLLGRSVSEPSKVSAQVKPQKQDWGTVLADCRRIKSVEAQKQQSDVTRVACRYAVTVPAQSEALVWAKLPN